ncbi:O-antigen ligase [Natronincola peptidivorans]|uniref:O-antigen ligase n=1 Tax=Natronincola peptidivorans TaxID=426128 RepID=A0A1I0CR46_9FIRM|nr:O-antigen ligase family protein [Natronincola peptidivorans]SET22002.1 O-antigen ligase [Natronincola peptidivorans]
MATKRIKKLYNKEEKRSGMKVQVLFLCIIVSFLPLFRGLFFEKEFYTASIMIALLALGAAIRNVLEKEKMVFSTWIEYLITAMMILYVVSFPLAINKHKAVFEAIKNTTYFLIFFITVSEIKGNKEISTISWSILLSGTIVSIIGIGASFGSFTYQDAFKEGMISSTFQYHNTFGAFMLATLFLAMGEITANEGWKKYTAVAMGYLLFFGLIFSYSRGAWLLLPVVGFIALVLMKKQTLKDIIFSFVGIILAFGITTPQIYKAIQTSNQALGWSWLLIGSITTVGVTYLLHRYVTTLHEQYINKKSLIVIISITTILLTILLTNGHMIRLFPETVSSRLATINLRTFTVVERGVFYQDALKVVKDYPILGTGGGGWAALYGQYKTYDYTTTEVHNNIMQSWIESGTIGLFLLLGIYACFLWISYKTIKNIEDQRLSNKLTGIICAVLAMMLHNTIDFNMSLGAYAVIFWLLIAIVTAAYKNYIPQPSKTNITRSLPKTAIIALSIVVLLLSGAFRLGIKNATTAIALAEEGDYYKSMEHLEKASRQYLYNATYHLDLAQLQLLIGLNAPDEALIEKSKKNVEKALSRDSNSMAVLQNAINYYTTIGEYARAVELVEKYLESHSLSDHTYNFSIDFYYAVGSIMMDTGETTEAEMYFERVLELEQRIEEINKELLHTKETVLRDVSDAPEWYVKQRFHINLDQNTIEKINIAKERLQQED